MFSDEDESILTENEKNGISDVLKTIPSKNNCVSSLDILQDDVINDSNDVMDISIHGNFVNSKISGPDSLTSLVDPEPVLALTYDKETKEVQTSFPVKTEVATQVNLGIITKITVTQTERSC